MSVYVLTHVCIQVGVTCCVLIPDFDRAVMGGCCYLSGATRRHRQEHTAGCGLEVASVLHNFTARLTEVPELITQTQFHGVQMTVSEVSKLSTEDSVHFRDHH